MSKKTILFLILCFSIVLNVGLLWKVLHPEPVAEATVERTETTDVTWTEKKDSMPEAESEKVVGTIKVPVRSKINENRTEINDSCSKSSSHSGASKSITVFVPIAGETVPEPCDSVEVELTQKVYSDSTYTAYVSGYMPSLDSIFVRQKETTRTITETKTIRERSRRWNVGIVAGYGYGFNSKTIQPFVGVGVTYNLFR